MSQKAKKILKRIKGILKLIRQPAWKARLNYTKYYTGLPLNEKYILFESEHGIQINGNIFYLLKYLVDNPEYKDYSLFVSVTKKSMEKIQAVLNIHSMSRVNVLLFQSKRYFQVVSTAKYLINDTSFYPWFIKKDGQVYLNTWHGTPLKTMGKKRKGPVDYGNIQKNFFDADYLLYPNEYTKDRMLEDYMLYNLAKGKTVLGGYPRNEIFFDKASAASVRENKGLKDKRIYAYMPTWRGIVGRAKSSKELADFLEYIDSNLFANEEFYVNLHQYSD